MKCQIAVATLMLSAALAANSYGENLLPGQVDLGGFAPPRDGGQFVEVNLTSSLIGFAARLVEKQEPDVAQLLNGLHLVRVTVIGLDEENRGELQKRSQALRKELDSKGWERVVVVHEHDQDVGIYLKTRNQDVVQGLVVTVMEGNKQAVFINIVGNIKPEQLAMLGERLHIDPLKKLGGITGKASSKEESHAEKAE